MSESRKLAADWSLEGEQELLNTFMCADLGVDYNFIRPVRWWQFWRWRLLWREDYVLSRAGDIIMIRQMADWCFDEPEVQEEYQSTVDMVA
jgi:hypothetical protein